MIVLFAPIFNAGLSVSLSQAPPCMAYSFSLPPAWHCYFLFLNPISPLFLFFFFFFLHMNPPVYHLTLVVFAFAFGESFSPSWTPNSLPTRDYTIILVKKTAGSGIWLIFFCQISGRQEREGKGFYVWSFSLIHLFHIGDFVDNSTWTPSSAHTKRLLSSQCSPLFQHQIAPTLRQTVMV